MIAKKPKPKTEKNPKRSKRKAAPKFKFESKRIPTTSGCYLFYDKADLLLYVGKAKNLRKRVSQYFQKTKKAPKTKLMVSKIERIETRVVHSEIEALILENNLIKEYKPRFNVLLRDDKNFLYLRVTNQAEPKLEIVRRVIKDGSTYFGPKTSAKAFRETIRFCQKFFGAKMVKSSDDYYINQFLGKEISLEEYRLNIEQMKRFLRGQTDGVLAALKKKMLSFAADKNFEAAAKTRDIMESIAGSTQKQTVAFNDLLDRDFVHYFVEKKLVYVVRIAFRQGKLRDQNEMVFRVADFSDSDEIIHNFLMQFYERVTDFPREIYIPEVLEDAALTAQFLTEHYFDGQKVEILVPQKGDKKKVLELAWKNAKNFAKKEAIEVLSQSENFSKALPELAKVLELPSPPKRMECYDISHYSGRFPVGSLVVFENGKPKTSQYRRFNIKDLPEGKIDDYAALKEVLGRRFIKTDDKRFAENMPDLVVIDGGKGQLSTVLKIFKTAPKEGGLKGVFPKKIFDPQKQIISLAKREEQIFRAGVKEPLELDFESPALKLLQRLRDEAHRFAISAHRNLRRKSQTKSALDDVQGIGPATKKKLMQAFETVGNIRKATDAQLLKIISHKQLSNLRKQL